ncbi:MAG: carbonic anhydrase [Flavobacteriaceae bacterium]
MDLSQIFVNNKKWISDKLATNPNYFTDLAHGQTPDILYIGCSDSRVTAEELMGVGPGEAFVHRNIANSIVNTDLNSLSVIHYAVDHLNISHVVICGHYGCGGVKAAMQSDDLGILNPWLREIRDVYRLHKKELNSIEDPHEKYNRLVELNVQEQCISLIKIPTVQKAHRNRDLQVHGWVFDIETGKLIDLKINFDKILHDIVEIYKIDDLIE